MYDRGGFAAWRRRLLDLHGVVDGDGHARLLITDGAADQRVTRSG